jgi:hypothetical protein
VPRQLWRQVFEPGAQVDDLSALAEEPSRPLLDGRPLQLRAGP